MALFFHIRTRIIRTSCRCAKAHYSTISKWLPALGSLLGTDPKIRQVGDPVLREEAEPVDSTFLYSHDFKEMLERMIKVMRSKHGSGIAAPQIGVGLQVFAMEFTGQHYKRLKERGFSDKDLKRMGIALVPLKVFINPDVKILDHKMLAFREGCLSVEGFSALVPRAKEVKISALDTSGSPFTWQAAGWPARIIQHEMDHLKGNLYIDTMLYKSFINNKWEEYTKK